MSKHKILFVCEHNAGRSQMAAAFFTELADPAQVVAISAGLDPAPRVHPEVVEVMREVGHDLSGVEPVALTARMQSETLFLVTMGCGERCPLIPPMRREDWTLEDPAGQPLELVRRIRDEIRGLVETLLAKKGWARSKEGART